MTEAQFWEIIELSRKGGCESQGNRLQAILFERSPQEIVAFDRCLRQKLIESYRWDLWGVAYLINGGCSEDGFVYFRGWLIAQGQQAYKAILADPQRILEFLTGDEEELECEALLHASSNTYEDVMGEAMPTSEITEPIAPTGEPWQPEDLPVRFPKIAERYVL
ncbi:DUF4240 domain-containing protein [Phormidium tenue FACHB-886]|nr:DUF4240 domain-containing protein [Phormidium tenue FACHB-886]